MQAKNTWIKTATLFFFFGCIGMVVAFRTGAFDGAAPAGATTPQPDSPGVKRPGIYSTKSGKVFEWDRQHAAGSQADSSASDSIFKAQKAAKPDSSKKPPFIISSSKSMMLPEPAIPDSTQKAKPPAQQPARKKASRKPAVKKQKSTNANNAGNNVVMPSSKSGPVFAPNN